MATIDYLNDDDTPMMCGDCGAPMLYDYSDDQYHHAVNAERGCFLIPDESRDDDKSHPAYLGHVTFGNEKVSLTMDGYHATITANDLDTRFRLNWTDGVTGDWTEDYPSLGSALARLALLDHLRIGGWSKGFKDDERQFAYNAHRFLTDQC